MKNRTRNGIAMLCLLMSASLLSCQKEPASSTTNNSNADTTGIYVNDPSDLALPDELLTENSGNEMAATATSITAGTRQNLIFNYTTEPANSLTSFSYTSPVLYGSLQKFASYSATRTASLARTGIYAVRYELRKTDGLIGYGKRTETCRYSKGEPLGKLERWYAASYYLPSDYVSDAAPESITQWHTNIGSPPLSLWTQNGQWRITRFGNKQTIVGNYEKNRWVDFVFHVKWSTAADGLIEVWKNGVKVYTFTGVTMYAGTEAGAYMRTGIYKWPWNPTSKIVSTTTKRVLYIDDVRIGNQYATYRDVAPGNY